MDSRDFFNNPEMIQKYKDTRYNALYVIKQNTSEKYGLFPKFLKIGISRGSVFKRLRSYNTYWIAGFKIFYIALVSSNTYDDSNKLIFDVETKLKNATFMVNRIRNTESFLIAKNNAFVISEIKKFLLDNKNVMSMREFYRFRHKDIKISPDRFKPVKTRRSNRIVTAPSVYPKTFSINTKIKKAKKKKERDSYITR